MNSFPLIIQPLILSPINYGGRDEVTRATKRMAKDVLNGNLEIETINEETLPKYLDTHVLPDPGLVIRTSGEARISNFLLWQSVCRI